MKTGTIEMWVVSVLMVAGFASVAPAQTPAGAETQTQAQGQAQAKQDPPAFTDAVVVTANRIEQRVSDVPASVTVITREDIARSSALTVDELLRRIPGFSLLRQGNSRAGHPALRSASLRGLGGSNSSRTLVLVDGVPMNDPLTSAVYWARLPLDDIERIEVVKGGVSGLWGNLALGGVIHVITSRPKSGDVAASLIAEGGNKDTGNVYGSVQGGKGRLHVKATSSFFHTNGYPIVREDQRGSIDGNVEDDAATFDTRIDYEASARARWTVGASVYSENHLYASPYAGHDINGLYLRGAGEFTTTGSSQWRWTGFLNRQRNASAASSIAPDRTFETPASDQFRIPAMAVGSNLQWSRALGSRHVATAGADLQWIDAETNEDFTWSVDHFTRRRQAGGSQWMGGLYVQDMWQLARKWRLVSAARLDLWQTSDGARREVDLATGGVVRDEVYGDQHEVAVNPSVGVVYQPREALSFRSSAYRAFRAPTPGELYRPFRAPGNVITESNATLTPERLTGVEGGTDVRLRRNLSVHLTGFWSWLEDPVTTVTIASAGAAGRPIAPCGFVPARGVCRQRLNVGELTSRGVETEVDYRPGGRWAVSFSYLFNESDITEAPGQPQLVGKANKHSPQHNVGFIVDFLDPRLFGASVEARYVSARYEDDLNSLPIADYFLTNVRVSRPLTAKLEIFLSVQNLFDTTYEISRSEDGIIGIGAPRLVSTGVRARF